MRLWRKGIRGGIGPLSEGPDGGYRLRPGSHSGVLGSSPKQPHQFENRAMTEHNPTLGTYKELPCHHWDDELPLIAAMILREKPNLVVETGTMFGGFAAFLADQVAEWLGQVITVDIKIYNAGYLEQMCATRPNLNFVLGDVFGSFVASTIASNLEAYE